MTCMYYMKMLENWVCYGNSSTWTLECTRAFVQINYIVRGELLQTIALTERSKVGLNWSVEVVNHKHFEVELMVSITALCVVKWNLSCFKATFKPAEMFFLTNHKVTSCYLCILNLSTSFLLAGLLSWNTQANPNSHFEAQYKNTLFHLQQILQCSSSQVRLNKILRH